MARHMFPIHSELKSRRLRYGLAVNHISWAYMKELREHNKTRKIYDVNPYVETYQFRDNIYGLLAENLDGMGDVWMYLIIGPEKAMLIDTAYGLGDLKGLVDQLTGGKPLYVVNTHEHYDHAYGNCRFDKVYCHEYLVPYLEMQHAHMWDYTNDPFGKPIWVDYDQRDLPVFKKYEIVGVPDGYTFDLGGGHEIELIFTGGHTAGHAAYLDKKDRILFSGDNICSDFSSPGSINVQRPGPHGECTLLPFYRERVAYLVSRIDEFDHVFTQHYITDLECDVLYDVLEACDSILADPLHNYDYMEVKYGKMPNDRQTRYYKYVKGLSVMSYMYKDPPAEEKKKDQPAGTKDEGGPAKKSSKAEAPKK